MTHKDVMRQALDALNNSSPCLYSYQDENALRQQKHIDAIAALTAALAEPSEPVAFFDPQERGFYWANPVGVYAPASVKAEPLALYLQPPVPEPLSDEEIQKILTATFADDSLQPDDLPLVRAIEAAIRGKR